MPIVCFSLPIDLYSAVHCICIISNVVTFFSQIINTHSFTVHCICTIRNAVCFFSQIINTQSFTVHCISIISSVVLFWQDEYVEQMCEITKLQNKIFSSFENQNPLENLFLVHIGEKMRKVLVANVFLMTVVQKKDGKSFFFQNYCT